MQAKLGTYAFLVICDDLYYDMAFTAWPKEECDVCGCTENGAIDTCIIRVAYLDRRDGDSFVRSVKFEATKLGCFTRDAGIPDTLGWREVMRVTVCDACSIKYKYRRQTRTVH